MLSTHLHSVEGALIDQAQAAIAALPPGTAPAAGPLTLALARQFLEPMFGGALRVASGALVGPDSLPSEPHPLFDALLCSWEAPRLTLADGQAAWLADTVVASVSVAPVLDQAAMTRAVKAASSAKALAGTQDGPGLRCYLLAADGPPDMQRVHGWLKLAYREQGIEEPDMPPTGDARCGIASPALDGVFVLGRGFLNFDNVAVGFLTDESRELAFGLCWAVCRAERGALMSLWLQLQQAANAAAGRQIDPRAWIAGFKVPDLRYAN
jgi:hypothetical protein